MQTRYDIAILGAGAAGCAAARAFAHARPSARIALVEQGHALQPPRCTTCPALQPYLPYLPSARRCLRYYDGVAEANLAQRTLRYWRGCGLGGSGSLCNDMRYMRGSRADFAAWQRVVAETCAQTNAASSSSRVVDWGFDAMLPFFIALEQNTSPLVHAAASRLTIAGATSPPPTLPSSLLSYAETMHGTAGWWPVSDVLPSNARADMNARFFDACEAAGVAPSGDFNAGAVDGFAPCQSLVYDGRRVHLGQDLCPSAMNAASEEGRYLQSRIDLHCGQTARRLLFQPGTCAVRGVELRRRPAWQRYGALNCNADVLNDNDDECESSNAACVLEADMVVCCLGALGNAVLLQRSGVGPQGAVCELPAVGASLIQSCAVDLVFRTAPGKDFVASKAMSSANAAHLWRQWAEYTEDHTGIFASHLEAVAFVRARPTSATADIALSLFRTPQAAPHVYCRPGNGFTVRVTHHYPRSRGSVRLVAAAAEASDPKRSSGISKRTRGAAVQIVSNLLSDADDVRDMDEGVQWAALLVSPGSPLKSVLYRDMAETDWVGPLAEYEGRLAVPPHGLPTQRDTAAFFATAAQGSADCFGTCAMGGVVDDRLRVRGLCGVVVADASVVPCPTVASSAVLGAAIGARAATL